MKNGILNELISTMRERIPQDMNLANTLADILCMGKEAVYRRLRGEVSFTIDEVALLSQKLGISIDQIVGSHVSNKVTFDLNLLHATSALESYYEIINRYLQIFDYVKTDNTTEVYTASNSLPFTLYSSYENLSKFRLCRWMYQNGDIKTPHSLEDMSVDERIVNVHKKLSESIRQCPKTFFIWDTNIFYSFVKEPVRIDNLIVTHKYICDVWKNGSKHLYFYTLHNQEHAIVLIQNIVKLINTIDFLKISSIDYYILFLACYLHDISMVKIPACDSFLLDTDKADELAKTLLDSYNEEFNKANLTKNVQGNDIDILSVKKYMLDSYRKIDNYFEEAVRSKHANDSAAEIRKRSELNYLDTSMRELVAEVSEAHGADERDIYGIKSVASKQLISIKFDKILLRLADLLDMSSYRVSKPILYHNVEQMSEESAFHWISHLLTKGYSLRTEYEITDNAHVLAPKNIIEKLVLEIPVNISQMSALTCGRTCKKVGIDRNRLSQQGIVLVCGQECKDNGNQERNCNFLCKWFCVKNENLIKELAALKEYLNRNKNNYFKSAIEIRIKCNDRTSLDARQFEILNEYIGKM